MVTVHDALNAHLLGSNDGNDDVHELVDARLKHDGTLEPVESTFLEIAKHGRVDDGVDGFGVGFGSKQETGNGCLVELTRLGIVSVGTYKGCEFTTDIWRSAYEPFGGCIAVIDLVATLAQTLTDLAFSATDSSGNTYLHGSSDSIR